MNCPPSPGASPPSSPPPPPLASKVPKWVLIVDDDPLVRRSLERLARRCGVRVLSAVNPADALRRVRHPKRVFELAILDIELGDPKRNGVDLGVWLRSRGYARRVLFYSAQQATNVYLQAVKIGEYVPKGASDGVPRLIAVLKELAWEQR